MTDFQMPRVAIQGYPGWYLLREGNLRQAAQSEPEWGRGKDRQYRQELSCTVVLATMAGAEICQLIVPSHITNYDLYSEVAHILLLDARFFHILHNTTRLPRLISSGETHNGTDLYELIPLEGAAYMTLVMQGPKTCRCGRDRILSDWHSVIFPPHEVAPCQCQLLDHTNETGRSHRYNVKAYRKTDVMKVCRLWAHLIIRVCLEQGIPLPNLVHGN